MLIGPVELATLPEWEPSPGSLVSWHPKPRFAGQGRRGAGESRSGQLHPRTAPSQLRAAGRRRVRSFAAAHRRLRGVRQMRYPCHDIRHQCPPSAARHISQLVRVPGCRPHRSAHHCRPGRYRIRPHRTRRKGRQPSYGTTYWPHRIRCSGTVSASGSCSVRTASRSTRASIICTPTASSSAWDSWSSRPCTPP